MTWFRLFRICALWTATILVATGAADSKGTSHSCPLFAPYFCACSLDEEPVVKLVKICLRQKLVGYECHPCPDAMQDYVTCEICPGNDCPICFQNEFDFRRHYGSKNNIYKYLDISNTTIETSPEEVKEHKILETLEIGVPHRSGEIENSSHTAIFPETEYLKNEQNEFQENEDLEQEEMKRYFPLFHNDHVYGHDNLIKLERPEDNGFLSKSDSDGGRNQSFTETSSLSKFLIIEDAENKIEHLSSDGNDLNSSKLNLAEGSGKKNMVYNMDDLEAFLIEELASEIEAYCFEKLMTRLLYDIEERKTLKKNNFNQAEEMNEFNKLWKVLSNLDNEDDVESNTQVVSEERNRKIPKKFILRRSNSHPASSFSPLMFRAPLPLAPDYPSRELSRKREIMKDHNYLLAYLLLNKSYLNNEYFLEILKSIFESRQFRMNTANLPTELDSKNVVSKQPSVNDLSNNQTPHTDIKTWIAVHNFINSTYTYFSCKNANMQIFLNFIFIDSDLMKRMSDRKSLPSKESRNSTPTSEAIQELLEKYGCTDLYSQDPPTNDNSVVSTITSNVDTVQTLMKGIQEKSPNSTFMNQAENVIHDNKDEYQGEFQEYNRSNFYNVEHETSAGNSHQKYVEEHMQTKNESEPVTHDTRLLTRRLLQNYDNEAGEEQDHITLRLLTREKDNAFNFEPHQEGRRRKRQALPHNSWCTITLRRRHGDMECTVWTNKKLCHLQCHRGYVIDATKTANGLYNCARRENNWKPTDILPCVKGNGEVPPEYPDNGQPEDAEYEEDEGQYDDDGMYEDEDTVPDTNEDDYSDDVEYYD